MELSMFVAPGEFFDVVELGMETMSLYDRLVELAGTGVESVRHAAVPADVAPRDAFAVGSLQVTLAPAALTAVVELVREWLTDRSVPYVRMVIDGDLVKVGRPSRAQRRRLDEFLRRHGG